MTPELIAAIEAAAALHQSGRLDEAEFAYQALLAAPGAPRSTLLQLLGMLHTQAGRPDAALRAYATLLEEGGGAAALDRLQAEALNDRALARSAEDALTEALTDYDAALALAPDLAVAWSNRSVALRRLGRREEAAASARQALALQPRFAEAWNNLGLALSSLNRLEDALEAHETALRLRPRWAEALNNAGLALAALGRLDAAEAYIRDASRYDPGHGAYPYNLALLALRRGDFAAGWRQYEHRWRRPGQPGPTYPDATLWRGDEDMAGRTLLVHAEQGLGDTLQFCRYLPQLKRLGVRTALEVQPALASLMRTLEGVDQVLPIGARPPPFDRHIPLMSLPHALGLITPEALRASVPYLSAEPEATASWRDRLASGADHWRIGVVWAGNPAHENDHNRSIPLAALEPVAEAARAMGALLVSLQTPLSPTDAAQLQRWGAIEAGSALADFSDTAAALHAIDLLIAVDTSVIHLAGALGRPAWLMLPAVGDWRWMDERCDSLWYPDLRLFRQTTPGDWTPVLQSMASALRRGEGPCARASAGL